MFYNESAIVITKTWFCVD